MRILVTGGAGFIGSHLVKRLLQVGAATVVFDNLHRGRLDALPAASGGLEFVQGDIRDRDALRAAMRGVQLIYHLAAQSNVLGSILDPDYCFTSNVDGTYNVLREAQASGCRRVVFTSSREVYGDPDRLPVAESAPVNPKNSYGASKAAAEIYCRMFDGLGLETVVLRLGNVYGCGDRDRVIPLFVAQAAVGLPITVFGENKILDFIWIDDVVKTLLEAGARSVAGKTLNAGTGCGTRLEELARRIVRSVGSSSPIRVVPSRESEVDRFVADIRNARELLDLPAPSDPLYRLEDVVKTYLATCGGAVRPRCAPG
jgi:UDP-glucose 4-epimerase